MEAVRALRTSLHFAMMETENNILMITGATPDSGKTFVSSTLAAVIAQSDQKVLFIDADLRHGYSHNLFTVSNAHGLTTGELSPHHAHCVTLYHNDLTCEADTFGSCGYVYLAVYPTPETKK